jgi:hypothetical protein
MAESRWAILLCKFSADQSATLPVDHYKRLFTGAGADSNNMTNFFSIMSHGQLDLTNSKVFGWLTIGIKDKAEYDSFDAKHAADPSIPGSRDNLMAVCKQEAIKQGVPLQNFAGVVICMNGPMDYFGALGAMTAVFDSATSLRPSVIGQEMGHGYGLDHSRREGSQQDYQDPWDVMSTDGPYEQPDAEYGSVGPGLNASNMRSRSWLDESRVWKAGNSDFNTTIKLRPLHRHDLAGTLAADLLGEYLVEYRIKERWDAGIPRSAVFVHRFADNHSYVMPGTKGNYDLVAGDKFEIGNSHDVFSSFTQIEVSSIDDANKTATINLSHRSAHRIPDIVGTIIGGVANDGGGWIIINGHVHRVPPYDPPGIALLQDLAAYLNAGTIRDVGVRLAARRSALAGLNKGISALGASLNPFRVPAKAPTRGKE